MDVLGRGLLLGLAGLLVVLCNTPAIASNCTVKSKTTCKECVGQGFTCFWCTDTKECSTSKCGGKWYGFGQCEVTGNLVIIIAPVAAVVVLLVIGLILYCCCCKDCCKQRRMKKWAAEDAKNEREKEDREAKHAARAEEMKLKHDQIRMKYGLFKDEPKYEQFDNKK